MKQKLLFQTPEVKHCAYKYKNFITKYEVVINKKLCRECGLCVQTCPEYIGSAQFDFEAFQKHEG